MTKTDVTKLETESKKLELSKAYDALFSNASTSKTYTECKVFESGSKKHDGAKKLCNKLLYILENIAKNPKTADNAKQCSYLRYWFYDDIRGFHTEHSKKIGEISFVKELIDIRSKVHKNELKNMCDIPYDKDVNLDEWRKRKLSYIYYKNHDHIKNISISTKKTECDKHLAYVESFISLYKEYYEKHCRGRGFLFFSPVGTDYFPCSSLYDPNKLLAALKICKPPEPPKSKISASSAPVSGRAGGAAQVSSAVTRGSTSSGGTRGTASPVTAVRGAAVPGPVSTLQPAKFLAPSTGGIPGQSPRATLPPNLQIRNDTGHGATAAVPSSLDSASNKMDSNFIRDIIMGVAVIGTILFLFFYNMSSGLKFSSPIKKRKKKKLKHNYYEEYEKEFQKYGSEDMSLDSEEDRYYLNYQPERDKDY
ncbi:PIR protein [Plasmodium vivax]|uniref:VIR protein n=1 Tax=Plasmodium vivax TaxID=5855 RepID=A0A565A701_PLAVI|nr:PIR protein [Plasmodium vivax]